MSDRPSTQFTNPDNLPAYLKDKGRFALWKYEWDGKRWTKVSYKPRDPAHRAASDNAADFVDLQTAYRRRAGFDGLTFGIFGDLAAIDIDHAINEAGELSVMAQTIIETMDSYTEYSPSGKGIRIIFRAPGFKYDTNKYYINRQDAKDPRQTWEQKQGLEVYIAGATKKYVTVTGNTIRAKDAEERSAQVQQVLDLYMKRNKPAAPPAAASPSSLVGVSDRELLDTARRSRKGAQFTALYDSGDITGYPSHSEADQALMNTLCFYTGRDKDRMLELFRASALYRPESKPASYYARTADRAIADCKEVYTPQQAKPEAATKKAQEQKKEETETAETPKTTADALKAFLDRAETRDFEPIPTGYSSIDAAIGGGFIRQTIVLLGAAPGAGKTIFAQQTFENIAKEQRGYVLYYNLEMSTDQMLARSLSRATQLPPLTVLQGYKWEEQERYDITIAAQKYRDTIAPRIEYNPCTSADYRAILESMNARADALKEQGNTLPLLVVVDYLQLLQGEERDAAEIIKAALKGFKDFAMQRGAVVFLIMAQSRATNDAGKITQGAGRDTSAIEYSGDLQLALTYSGMLQKDKNGESIYKSLSEMRSKAAKDMEDGFTEEAKALICGRTLTVTKNRFSADFTACHLFFEGEYSRFIEIDTKHKDKGNKWANAYSNDGLPFPAPTQAEKKKPKLK